MAEFLTIPAFKIVLPDMWVLKGELVYRSDLWPTTIVVPEGFLTDLASIPRVFRSLIPQNGRHRAPAVVHDYLCRREDFPRRTADRIFNEAMKLTGVPALKRVAMYFAVRVMTIFLKDE